MASSAAATCLRLRVSDASRDTFREQTDAHLGASRAGCPHWSSEPHRFFDEVVAICDSALDRELRDAVRGFLTGGGPSSASSLILSNCGVDPDLPPTSLAMEANRDAMEQGEGQGDRQTAAQAAVRTAFRKPGQHSEAWLFALSVLSGGTLTHSNPMETARGPILSNIIPIPERAHYQTPDSLENSKRERLLQANFGSSTELGLHRDGNFDADGLVRPPYAPRAACLFCLRGNARATTFLADNRAICAAADPDDLALLRATPLAFRMRGTDNGGTPARYDNVRTFLKPHPILHGSETDPHLELNYDREIDMERCECADVDNVLAAYERVKAVGMSVAQHATLQPGELLVMLNWRTQHGRTPFRAAASATERWLQRFWLFSAVAPDALAFDAERRERLRLEPAAAVGNVAAGKAASDGEQARL